MLQRYKVRLGDGTVLTVDDDGLRGWAHDANAAVHVAGLQEWRPVGQFLAEEESRARLARALVPPSARHAPTPRPEPTPLPAEVPPPNAPVELSIGRPPLVQALADEPLAPATSAAPGRDAHQAAVEAPVVLRLKPPDDEPPRRSVTRHARVSSDDPEDEGWQHRHDRLDGPVLEVINAFATLLSRCLDPLTPLVRGWPPPVTPASAGVPTRSEVGVLPRGDDERLQTKKRPPLFGALLGWIGGLTESVRRLVDRSRPTPRVAPDAPSPISSRTAPPRTRLAPPVPISEMPVLRFADNPEAPELGDVYEGEGEEGSRFRFSAFWLWTKRLVLAGSLTAAALLTALNWETWFPRAVELERTLLGEIDWHVRSRQRAAEQQQTLRETTERLPHLAPGTIALLLATFDGRGPDPAEAFQLASEAADRGHASLTPAEAAELRALRGELLANLEPPEREQVAEYDRARSRRVVFSFENSPVLELVARAARAMPSPSRGRLQTLLGKAIAAGLRVPATAAGTDGAHPGARAGR
jgi:hypothetical protein